MALDSVRLSWPITCDPFDREISILLSKKEDGIEIKQDCNIHAYDYKYTIKEEGWLDLIASAKEAELEKIENVGEFYRRYRRMHDSEDFDSVYFVQIKGYKIFISYRSSFLWVVTAKELEVLRHSRRALVNHIFNNRNIGDSEHYRERHQFMMECLKYLGLLDG